jgi:hypothetical protein
MTNDASSSAISCTMLQCIATLIFTFWMLD